MSLPELPFNPPLLPPSHPPAAPLRLLLVEDSDDDTALLLRELRRNGFIPEMTRVDRPSTFAEALRKGPWDLILADFNLPSFSGLDALALYQSSGLDCPFLLVSGTVGEDVAVSAMIAGAHDYVLKNSLTRLGPAVRRELREYQVRCGRREDHLRVVASERRFTTIFKNSPVAIIITDVQEGIILDVNPAALNLMGSRREAAVGRPSTELGFWSDPENRRQLIADALAAGPGHSIERTIVTAGRRPLTVLASFSLIDLDGQTRLLIMMQDITARKAAEETLRENEERYRLLVENSHDLVAEIDERGILLYASPNTFEVTGYTSAELIGRRPFDLVHPEDRPQIQRNQPADGHTEARYRLRHRAGHWLSFESTARTFTTSNGESRTVIVTRDLTEQIRGEEARRTLEAQLRQAKKMEAIGTLAGGIAHDFNNILTAIFGYVQLAELELPADHPARLYLTGVMRGSERARDLVAQILTFSRRREQQRTIAPMAPIVRDALQLLRASLPATIEFNLDIDPHAPAVLCDGTQLHQVVMNLGTNAAYAMREAGGILTVSLRETDAGPGIIASQPQFSRRKPVCLTIADTGVGMDASTRERIFEPFFTTKPVGEGTGLGLAVVHGIVQNHDGIVTCDSAPGAGTTFRIYLPAVDLEGMDAPQAPSDLPQGNGECLLVVDDEDSVVAIASRMLARLGYNPIPFTDSAAALERLLQDPGAFDLVLTDLTMSRVTGVDIARQARLTRPSLPVVITTGFMNVRDVDSARSVGVAHFLEKPFSLAALAGCIHQALGERNLGSRPPIQTAP